MAPLKQIWIQGVVVACLLGMAFSAEAVRIEDVVHVNGARSNDLIGYGVIVGLKGTGDKSALVQKNLRNMYQQLGLRDVDLADITTKNVASVSVSAKLPPFAAEGSKISITVASMGDASSLQGGKLLLTPLKGVDGEVYALAQGNVVIGQGSHLTVGTIPDGAVVEDNVSSDIFSKGNLQLQLKKANYATANSIQKIINQQFRQFGNGGIAKALNPGLVTVDVPQAYRSNPVSFVSQVMGLPILQPNQEATVVINERTGTIIIDENVEISPVAISQEGLNIRIPVNRNLPGQTNVYPYGGRGAPYGVPQGTKLKDLVDALTAMQVSTKDLIAILQSLKRSGALHAKLEVM